MLAKGIGNSDGENKSMKGGATLGTGGIGWSEEIRRRATVALSRKKLKVKTGGGQTKALNNGERSSPNRISGMEWF